MLIIIIFRRLPFPAEESMEYCAVTDRPPALVVAAAAAADWVWRPAVSSLAVLLSWTDLLLLPPVEWCLAECSPRWCWWPWWWRWPWLWWWWCLWWGWSVDWSLLSACDLAPVPVGSWHTETRRVTYIPWRRWRRLWLWWPQVIWTRRHFRPSLTALNKHLSIIASSLCTLCSQFTQPAGLLNQRLAGLISILHPTCCTTGFVHTASSGCTTSYQLYNWL